MANEVQEKDEAPEENKQSEKGGKKKMILILLPLILIIGGAVGVYFSGLSEKIFGELKTEEVAHEAPPAHGEEPKPAAHGEKKGENAHGGGEVKLANPNLAFYDLPEMLVNINTGSRRQSYLKTVITLEIEDGNQIPKLEAVLPRVIDTFQVYLRELRVEDLQGSAGMYRLKEELLDRLNKAADPVRINDVLFKEMLVQ